MLKPQVQELLRKHPRDMTEDELATAAQLNLERIAGHYDEKFSKALSRELLPFLSTYFRPRFHGFEKMPERSNPERPLIFASNHSGMAFPWDAMVLGSTLMEKHDFDLSKLFRPLAAPALSASRLMNPFLGRDTWRRVGAVNATTLNFESLMQQQDYNVLIYPEGIPGIGKGFNNRYKLQKFSTSMIRMALKYDTDIISLLCVNGEYINAHAYKVKWINKMVSKIGIPYLFIGPLTIPLILFPLIFYAALPAQLNYVLGKRYHPRKMLSGKAWEDISEEEIRSVRDQIQAGFQSEMNAAVEAYGQKPFAIKSLLRNLARHIGRFPYTTPIGWPAVFTEFDRLYHPDAPAPKDVTKGFMRFWRIILRNPIVLAYFLPIIGWIPVIWLGLRGRKEVKAWKPS
ncbi:MAG: 1-acyl-sn-glycerol-3-phosphate acyltransferase [Bacteroidia bacterium]